MGRRAMQREDEFRRMRNFIELARRGSIPTASPDNTRA